MDLLKSRFDSSAHFARSSSFSSTDLSAIKSWTDEEKKNLCITIWIDSQKMQFALCPTKGSQQKTIYVTPINVQKSSDVRFNFESLSNTLASYKCVVAFATMSFAGPVMQDSVVITNWACEPRERVIHFANLPFDLFPFDRRMLMNDLEACSYGIIARFMGGSLPKLFEPLWIMDPTRQYLTSLDGNSLVLWLGSGFSGSYICRHDSSDYNCVVGSESGHAQVYCPSPTSPTFEYESKFIKFVSQKFHGDSHQPEWEDMCSSRGLITAYQFVKKEKGEEVDKVIQYSDIRNLALQKKDEDAMAAFILHYTFIIRAAQSMILSIRCKRVFIISEIQVQNNEIVKILADKLKETFFDHPRKSWFLKTNFYVQKKSSTFALSGGLFLSKMFAMSLQSQNHIDCIQE